MTPLAKNNLAAPNIWYGDRGSLSRILLHNDRVTIDQLREVAVVFVFLRSTDRLSPKGKLFPQSTSSNAS